MTGKGKDPLCISLLLSGRRFGEALRNSPLLTKEGIRGGLTFCFFSAIIRLIKVPFFNLAPLHFGEMMVRRAPSEGEEERE